MVKVSFIIFLYIFLNILLIQFSYSVENKNFSYVINDIENYLIPKPQILNKGNFDVEIENEISFDFINKNEKENELLNDIINIYLNIFSNKNSKNSEISEIKKKSNSIKSKYKKRLFNVISSDNTKSQEEIFDKCKIIYEIKNLSIIKFSDDFVNQFKNIESYKLKINAVPQKENDNYLIEIKITANYLNGFLYALETLSQILNYNHNKKTYNLYNLPLDIEDFPSFPYRGIMIDTARHFFSIDKLKQIIDGMLYTKLNVFHWHFTDDENFSINLEENENENPSYSIKQIKELINYAYIRGITVIPEIDHPAHTRSFSKFENKTENIKTNLKIKSNRNLIKESEEKFMIIKGETGILNPAKNSTYIILDKIFKKISQIFQLNEKNNYIHLGGDEIISELWDRKDIKDFIKQKNLKNISDLENYFFNLMNKRLKDILQENTNNEYEPKFIYWVDENLKRYYDIYFNKNSVLMYWGLNENLKKFMDKYIENSKEKNKGKSDKRKKLIIASGDYLYMDCGVGNKYGDKTWCGDFKTWKHIYKIDLFEKYRDFDILGSQIVLFSELADEFNLIGKVFPRAFGLAEKLWNFEYTTNINEEKIKRLFIKIIEHNKRLNFRGIESISITSILCENNVEVCIDEVK